MKITSSEMIQSLQKEGIELIFPNKPRITVGMGTCGTGNGAEEVFKAFQERIKIKRLNVDLVPVGCFGACYEEPLVGLQIPNKPMVILNKVKDYDVKHILDYIEEQEIPFDRALCKIQEWDFINLPNLHKIGVGFDKIPLWNKISFFEPQQKIVLRHTGLINPTDIKEYFGVGGYSALDKVVRSMKPEDVIEEVKSSKIRGRGGAGFPTGTKWSFMRQAKSKSGMKYIICNADEGDPGAYMNRNEIEGDPHMLIEGMIIGAYAMGARSGIIYCRAEYPLAVNRLKDAIKEAYDYGILGEKILGTDFNFDLHIVEGAGAFVCGEETALIASIEGCSGRPKPRPPFPAQKGLYGEPTNINNVETWCNIPAILSKGGKWFASTGIDSAVGTKVFSLVGTVKNTGLVELPLGTVLNTLIFDIGGGSSSVKQVKAVQLGGPSGGCLPVELFNTSIDYESLNAKGAIMGSGGVVVMDEFNCMCDIARYFISFTASESCGKCTPCREGLPQALQILNRIVQGKGNVKDLDHLEELGNMIKDCALCGLGQTAPNPVITTLKYFRKEYLEHIEEKRCHAGICQDLFRSTCENMCPLHLNIPGFCALMKENRLEDAFELIMQDNPLPATTGRICSMHCNVSCRRGEVDGPVNARDLHRFIADQIYAKNLDENIIHKMNYDKLKPTNKKIAIVGSGPAGLTAAYYLLRLGHSVDIYEKQAESGGMLRYCIPEYRLPLDILKHEIGFVERLGGKIIRNVEIGVNKPIQEIIDNYDTVLIATGTQKEIPLNIPGNDLRGVLSGMSELESIRKGENSELGNKVIVIGGGNAAIDVARSAIRLGSSVNIAYRRGLDDMPAIKHEIQEAIKEGVKFQFMVSPHNIIGRDGKVIGIELMKMAPGKRDKSGRRISVPTGETVQVVCDSVDAAIGEKIDTTLVEGTDIETTARKEVWIDPLTFQTKNKKVFAAGDFISGPSTAAESMGAGKRAAFSIDEFLTGKNNRDKIYKHFSYNQEVPEEPECGDRNVPRELSVEDRIHNFKEVVQDFSKGQALIEACRCLRCDVKEARK
jgi:NADH-quinone oxidoreductase subunit F